MLPKIHVKYRADKRIRIVEVTTGAKRFLVGLQDFGEEVGIDYFEESIGEVFIDPPVYKTLWEVRMK